MARERQSLPLSLLVCPPLSCVAVKAAERIPRDHNPTATQLQQQQQQEGSSAAVAAEFSISGLHLEDSRGRGGHVHQQHQHKSYTFNWLAACSICLSPSLLLGRAEPQFRDVSFRERRGQDRGIRVLIYNEYLYIEIDL